MLNQLMNELTQGGTASVAGLAAKMRTSPALVQMMLEELERQGRIHQICAPESSCANCAIASSCMPRSPGKTWVISEG